MRGPSGRVKYVAVRTWECPACQKRLVTPGRVVHVACTCTPADQGPRWMRLVDEPRPRRLSLPAEAAPGGGHEANWLPG
jgi:hypothetical protein